MPPRGLPNLINNSKSLFSNKPNPSCWEKRNRALSNKRSAARGKARDILKGAIDLETTNLENLEQAMAVKKMLTAADIQNMAREEAEAFFRVICEIAANEEAPPAVRLQAANMGLDRAFGKAATTNFNVNANMDAKPEELDDNALRRRIAQNLARAETLEQRLAAGSSSDGKTIEGEARPVNIRKYN